MPEDWLVRAPATLDDRQACTLPIAGLTAWFGLVERAGLRVGDTVLIPSTGGVALFGLQIAKAHGADHFIDSGRSGWMEQVYRATGDRGADVALEVIGTGSRSALERVVSAVDRIGIKPVIGLLLQAA